MLQGNSRSKLTNQARLCLVNWLFSPLAGVTWENWWYFLKYNGSSISARYWPRTLFTTAIAAINSMIAQLESKGYQTAIDKIIIDKPVFIIGHNRSGTTHLWNLLSQDPQFAYPNVIQAVFPHTFLTYEKFIQKLAKKFVMQQRPQDNVAFTPESPLEEERAICTSSFLSLQMVRHLPQMSDSFKQYLSMKETDIIEREKWKLSLDNFAKKLLIRYGQYSTLLFKSPDNTAKVKLLLELYPDARFIHIHRNPYRVFQSTMKMEKKIIPLYAYQKPVFDELEDFVLWRYKTMYDALLDDILQIPEGQFVELAYDELERQPLTTLKKVYDTLSLSGYEEVKSKIKAYLKSISGYKKNIYPDLPTHKKKRIFQEWHRSFEAFGYSA